MSPKAKVPFYVTPGGAKRRHPTNGPTHVYWLFDRDDQFVYIGVAFDLDARFKIHSTESGRWWYQVERFEATLYPTRREALAVERVEIGRHRPPHNKAGNPSYARQQRLPEPVPRQQHACRPEPPTKLLVGSFGAMLTEQQLGDRTRDQNLPDLVSLAQAAVILDKSEDEIMKTVRYGWVQGVYVDGMWVFRRDEITGRLPTQRTESATE